MKSFINIIYIVSLTILIPFILIIGSFLWCILKHDQDIEIGDYLYEMKLFINEFYKIRI